MAHKKFVNVTVRVPKDMVDRADALLDALEQDEVLTTFGRVSRNSVFRLAFVKGLHVLEEEYGPPRSGELKKRGRS